ncbi:Pimeloyl-ACP methyl ester carboxylesterase [Paenibacillus sp. UNC496MF]|uniref:epoxide hydrolase family protein n=1 Tax=Paenibacillus sp. UNC496MF TaxID=1502753 RepID=UPI0008E4DBA8|nr:epoxide hydrolase family protein [Paenibacillus sp. UNC496MF]SFI40828.1 Pimeloyl-ACP methyl ester carboxylesterase [Paenibacillus sp. UNC496MF]
MRDNFRKRMTMILALAMGLTSFGTIAVAQLPSDATPIHKAMAGGRKETAAIRPFRVHVPDAELADLRRRILATRWPDKETVSDQSQGVQLATIQALAHYWAADYDWRKFENRLNTIPQFVTTIDGEDIHFIHVRSKHKGALPIILTHGWPGSFIEMLKIIGPLTDPTAYGGKAEDAFDVVIPSIPGYGFSSKPTTTGWDPDRIARAWDVLMKRLGYDKYVAQGGDWGAIITDLMGVQQPKGLLGIHSNMPGTVPVHIHQALTCRSPMPSGLSEDEQRAWNELAYVYGHIGYAELMGTRPQTLTGLADSPVGLAAFMLDHDAKSLELISRAFAGQPEGLSRDDALDNITMYWLTNTPISSARLYWENKHPFFTAKGVKIPAAISVFPDELYQAPESWAKQAYPNLIYFSRVNKGGHFAAWEQPALFTEELRAAFRPLRKGTNG